MPYVPAASLGYVNVWYTGRPLQMIIVCPRCRSFSYVVQRYCPTLPSNVTFQGYDVERRRHTGKHKEGALHTNYGEPSVSTNSWIFIDFYCFLLKLFLYFYGMNLPSEWCEPSFME